MQTEQDSNLSASESQAPSVKQSEAPAQETKSLRDAPEATNGTDESTHKVEVKSGASETAPPNRILPSSLFSSRRPITFPDACVRIRRLLKNPSDYDVLEAYALFKQATEGDNETPIPNELDFVGLAKWDAWKNKRGLSSEEAQACYIDLVRRLESNN
ncbi:hypothetical protein DSO57_1020234 [Entomophthora muscae]|uniref:Uncharacterized protein n=1 Tax=Entomophthora muscae TaxID=34485 RepID=A0ACC2ST14_9FUNG|nr:hypothetical protein DSO57_1020234 [Entomophthora muscae]